MTDRLMIPMRLAPDGSIATVLQDSDEDVAQCLLATGRTEPGTRADAPNLGVSPLDFTETPVDTMELAEALSRGEPRRSLEVLRSTVVLDAATSTIAEEITIAYQQQEGDHDG